jgi:hypothetical protein
MSGQKSCPVANRENGVRGRRGTGRKLRIMAEGWDASASGVLRLPSGRLIRGRGLRLHVAEGWAPNFGLSLSNARPAPVAWQARWVRWPDFRLPRDRRDAADALREASLRAQDERVEVACSGGSWTDRNCPLLASRRWTAYRPSRRWPLCGSTTTPMRSRRRGSVGTWPPILGGVTPSRRRIGLRTALWDDRPHDPDIRCIRPAGQ